MNPFPRLYAIADASFGDPVQSAEALFAGGARLLQVRNKKAGSRELLRQIERILDIAPDGAKVIVNDRVDVALITGAAGVHLGQTDLPPEAARRILGPDRIVGFSTHNLEQALEADRFGADYIDYIAVGPVFATTTKENPDPVLGVEGFAAICRELRKPVVAIGGITLSDAPKVLKAGAGSIAVVRDLLSAADIAARTRDWMNSLDYK